MKAEKFDQAWCADVCGYLSFPFDGGNCLSAASACRQRRSVERGGRTGGSNSTPCDRFTDSTLGHDHVTISCTADGPSLTSRDIGVRAAVSA
jgi:hypothetical protein